MTTQTTVPTFNAEWVASLPGDLSSRIDAAKSFMGQLPRKPIKPAQKAGMSSNEVRAYAELLANWERAVEAWRKDWNSVCGQHKEVSAAIEQHIKDEAGLDQVPEQYRDRVYSHAWDSGHANGYYEVYSHLCSLIHIFTGK
jgi:hypothetical protein